MQDQYDESFMEILNITSLTFSFLPGRINYPGHSLTFIIKGTFDIQNDSRSTISDEQLYPTGDEFYPDDETQQSVRYESDFAYFKPKADILLAGHCYSPRGIPTEACKVTFQAGARRFQLAVFGNRYWHRVSKTISRPEPFKVMELRYENSFGGDGYKKNPIGKGYPSAHAAAGEKRIPLPNIEDIHQLVVSPSSRPEPAGFGPLFKMWSQRFSKLGTYDKDWLARRWPWFPEDFDWGFFNASPQAMQSDRYLDGDESLYLENLHPDIPAYHSQLPGLRIRCFLNRRDSTDSSRMRFEEIKMNLDTLWVDMDAEKLVLVWRGVTGVQSEEYEEIGHCFIVSEQLHDTPLPSDYYHQEFNSILAAEDKIFEEEMPEYADPEAAVSIKETILQAELEIKKAQEELRQELLAAGIDPDVEIPEPTKEDKEAEARLLARYGLNKLDIGKTLTREDVIQAVADKHSLAEEDLSNLDLSGLDLRGADFKGAFLAGSNLRDSLLDGALLSEADLSDTDLQGASLKKVDASNADFTGSLLSRTDFSKALLKDTIFEKALMNDVILDDVQCLDGYFAGADLSKASLKNAMLDGADFSHAVLDQASFYRSSLKDASVEGARGEDIVMDECDISGLRASEGCSFIKGSFKQVTADGSTWEEAVLTGAVFSYSDMMRADFSSAELEHVNFLAADLRQARFIKANLTSAICLTANFFEASFEKANLTNADFSGSNLYGAEFLDARISNTKFHSANLKMTKLKKVNG